MPRPRKYDSNYDLPVTLFIKVPIHLLNELEKMNISRKDLEKKITSDKVLVKYIQNLLKID